MRVGTKTLLFGFHQVALHGMFVAAAWWRLYGFPWDPRLWVSFFVHDLGYWGKLHLDDEAGQRHPELGAKIMGTLFGAKWLYFTLLHSRVYASRLGMEPSRLCYADKWAASMYPLWLCALLQRFSSEGAEYPLDYATARQKMRQWVRENQSRVS